MTKPTPPFDQEWPDRSRRAPGLGDRLYLALYGLSRELKRSIDRELNGRTGLRVVDLGCGNKPYYPWLARYAGEYIGVDTQPGPHVDQVSPAEHVAGIDSGSVDVVVCTQVLEHVENPAMVIGEIQRLLKPGGVCFLSTHGVFVYHGQPRDYWRWTHEGLQRVFRECAGFEQVAVIPTEGIASAVLSLVEFYSHGLAERFRLLRPLRFVVHALLNAMAPRLDRYSAWLFPDHPISVNYLVVARKSGVEARPRRSERPECALSS